MNDHVSGPSVPLNDLKRVYDANSQAVSAAVNAVLASGWWLNGECTRTFCEAFANYAGVKHCIGVANGTDALEIALRALVATRRPGAQEVVTVANAGGYSTIAARLVGLTPVYADIDERSQLADLVSTVSAVGERTAAVIVTHLYGGVVDVSTLRVKMDEAGFAAVPILEDCAQAHGARLHGRMVGSLGDIATFSFYPTKNLGAFGDAGAIVTSDDEIAATCDMLRQYAWSRKYTIARSGGRNSRLDEVQATILTALLPGLDQANARRVEILDSYADAMPAEISLVRSPHGTVGHLAIVLCQDRDRLRAHLAERRIATDIHYPILDCDQQGWLELPQGQASGGLPVSRRSAARVLTIPCFPGMTNDEVEQVSEALAAWRL